MPIGIYLSPGANAVETAAAVTQTLDRLRAALSARPARHGHVQLHHLRQRHDPRGDAGRWAIAFVLVVIVVFLFLGNVRATIIPTVAVPVSLIGTFAVLLALGYSANTISLLAMVLAIGIVVDDAIVVVENVERVMEEEPDLSPAEATLEGDAPDHRADHRHLPGAAVGVRAGRVHSGPVGHAVPPVRGDDQRGDGDLGAQRADPVAGAVRGVPAPCTAQRRGPMGWVLRGIDHARDGYARVVQRLVRVAGAGVAGDRRVRRRHLLLSAHTPTGFLPEEDQGAFFVAMQLPDGASVARSGRGGARGWRNLLHAMPQVQDTLSIIGFSLLDGGVSSRTRRSWWRG